MYFQYSNIVGEHEICRNVMVDDDLLKGENSFLFKEIISDFSFKQTEALNSGCITTVLAASNDFVNQNIELLAGVDNKKIFIFGGKAVSSKSTLVGIEYIDEEDIPLSASEWREKIITTEKTVVVKSSKLIDKLANWISDSKLPVRIKRKVLSRIPMSLEKLEKEIERDIVFLPFSRVKFIGNEKVSNKLINKCLLCGIRVDGIPISRAECQFDMHQTVVRFKNRILQYL
ncbi:hypothetical protein VIOR3934_06459 [Vibrio orientalis CIP 102891 = ATCC 33934]|uniref:Uncharacterized protein n=1 Tax=Vibrio orientalis CIP 102891 = ATCC 33934 TaxID=675816 RepID=C9QDG0_VIBOR|nr:hypothetical protein [Vibrio orientalis]EEX95062.1 hypothetical protein VIA_000525 [Vibrio orientalis CIP 102891 = ATCC 33934]EGU52123.1 hypothetical protein VIOR3934_06459 [Vibrio orientalis CIP 102891 = ATCC 33934]